MIPFKVKCYSDNFYTHYRINMPHEIRKASNKRKAEFLYGRLCLRRSIRIFSPVFDGEILISEDRLPILPPGFVGSISHTDDFAIAVAGRANHFRSIGIDTEMKISQNIFNEIRNFILTERESTIFFSGEEINHMSFTAIYSIKEAVFKMLFPITHLYFDFKDITVDCFDLEDGFFCATLLKTISLEFRAGMKIFGTVWTHNDCIIALSNILN